MTLRRQLDRLTTRAAELASHHDRIGIVMLIDECEAKGRACGPHYVGGHVWALVYRGSEPTAFPPPLDKLDRNAVKVLSGVPPW